MVVPPLLLLLATGTAAVFVPYHDDSRGAYPRPLPRLTTSPPDPYSNCPNVIPGLRHQVLGVDITALDYLPIDLTIHDNGFRGPIISLTCNNGSKYTINGVEYDMPDQLWHVEELPSGSLTATTSVMTTSETVKNTLSVSAGLGITTKKFAFSQTTTYSKMEQTINKNERKLEQTAAIFSARRTYWLPKDSLQMNSQAQYAYNNLPSDYLRDRHPYEEFIRQYGTHYISDAKLGGLMSTYMETLSDYYQFHSETDVTLQAEATFYGILETKGGTNHGKVEIDEKFTSNTTTNIRYYGGEANLMEDKGLAAWQPTISANPWLYSGLVRPISDLFPDENKKLQMNMAAKDYILLKYLTVELVRIIKTLPTVAQGEPEAQSRLREIEDMSKVRPLVESEVEELGKKVQQTYIDLFLDYNAEFDDFRKVNTWDAELNFHCPGGKSITRIYSEHSNKAEDREWSLGCNYLPGLGMMTRCQWTPDYVNYWDLPIDYTCPGGGVMTGWHSYHHNGAEDRRWKYMCCQVEGAVPENCQWTDYLNDWDRPVSLHIKVTEEVIIGVHSYHNNHAEDRRWKFLVCKQLRYVSKEKGDHKQIYQNLHESLAGDQWKGDLPSI